WYVGLGGLLVQAIHGVPLVVTLHSLEPLRPWKADQLGTGYIVSSWAERLAVERADRVIAVSAQMRADILANFRVEPERVVVLHNGVDAEAFARTERREALDRDGGGVSVTHCSSAGSASRRASSSCWTPRASCRKACSSCSARAARIRRSC